VLRRPLDGWDHSRDRIDLKRIPTLATIRSANFGPLAVVGFPAGLDDESADFELGAPQDPTQPVRADRP
jgi:hypothetical protein